jgi:hypothetical protein
MNKEIEILNDYLNKKIFEARGDLSYFSSLIDIHLKYDFIIGSGTY